MDTKVIVTDLQQSFAAGNKVHYIPHYVMNDSRYSAAGLKYYAENGIVKSVTKYGVFVVYHCGGEWARYEDFTAALTDPKDLRHGWL